MAKNEHSAEQPLLVIQNGDPQFSGQGFEAQLRRGDKTEHRAEQG